VGAAGRFDLIRLVEPDRPLDDLSVDAGPSRSPYASSSLDTGDLLREHGQAGAAGTIRQVERGEGAHRADVRGSGDTVRAGLDEELGEVVKGDRLPVGG
jgi:hypothetical protein